MTLDTIQYIDVRLQLHKIRFDYVSMERILPYSENMDSWILK